MAQSKGILKTTSKVQEKRQLPSYSYQGVEYSFFEPVPDELLCPICHEVLNEPLQTTCGHLFCEKCLNTSLRKARSSCPTCRTHCSARGFSDKHTERKVNNLQVKCCNFPCEWRGIISRIQDHKLGRGCTACRYEPVNCPLRCGQRVIPNKLEQHKQNACPLREVVCEYCQWRGLYKKLDDHYNNCRSYPLPCPCTCGAVDIPLHSMEAHLQECPEKKIKCPLSNLGCSAMMKRHSLEDHVKNSKDEHFLLTMKHVEQLSRAVVELTKVVAELSGRSCLRVPTKPLFPFTPRPWLENHKLFPSMPWIIRMDEFSKKKAQRDAKWTSDPFFSKPTGYKFQLSISVVRKGASNTDHLCVEAVLMHGPNDNRLTSPTQSVIELSVLNQIKDSYHHTGVKIVNENLVRTLQKVSEGKNSTTAFGEAVCVPLTHHLAGCQYLQDDCVFLKANYIDEYSDFWD